MAHGSVIGCDGRGGGVSYLLGIDVGTTRTAAASCRVGAGRRHRDRQPRRPRRARCRPCCISATTARRRRRGRRTPGHQRSRPGGARVQAPDRRPDPDRRRRRPWAPEELSARLVRWVVDRVARARGRAGRDGSPSPTRRRGARTRRTCSARRCAATACRSRSWPSRRPPRCTTRRPSGSSRAPRSPCTTSAAARSTPPSCTRTPPGLQPARSAGGSGAARRHRLRRGWCSSTSSRGCRRRSTGWTRADPARAVGRGARVRRECTEAKEALSADTEVSIPVLTAGGQRVGAAAPQRVRGDDPAPRRGDGGRSAPRDRLGRAWAPDQLTAVLLVGGSSRIPLVAQMVSEELGRPVAVDADPKNAIAKGAALSLTPAGISATGTYPPAPRGHSSGPCTAQLGAAGAPWSPARALRGLRRRARRARSRPRRPCRRRTSRPPSG